MAHLRPCAEVVLAEKRSARCSGRSLIPFKKSKPDGIAIRYVGTLELSECSGVDVHAVIGMRCVVELTVTLDKCPQMCATSEEGADVAHHARSSAFTLAKRIPTNGEPLTASLAISPIVCKIMQISDRLLLISPIFISQSFLRMIMNLIRLQRDCNFSRSS